MPGAFELPVAAAAAAGTERYACLVALGAVIRGDTPHFEYVAGEAARGLNAVAVAHALPVGFGVLTVDTMQQAVDRAGGSAGNKGHEAAAAALAGGGRHRPAPGRAMLRAETKSRARALQLLYAWELQGAPPMPGVATRALAGSPAPSRACSIAPRSWRRAWSRDVERARRARPRGRATTGG